VSSRPRRVLVGLVVTAAALAALPASALATITPALALNQTAGTTAGSSPAVGFNATFSPNPASDSVKDLSLALPPGLLANENINGGACLTSATPSSACQVGSGTITAGGMATPVTLYLVAPPKASDVGGLALVVGTTPGTPADTADVSLGATGLNVAFSNLPNLGISAMNVTFTNLRLPTSCPSPSANVTLTADSYGDATSKSTNAPFTVTGCPSLAYAPVLTAAITRDSGDSGGALTLGITQAATESASKSIVLQLPKGLSPNVGAVASCLNAIGCKIGTATATSPIVPSVALANGTVTLTAQGTVPSITVSFPAPFAISLAGAVNLNNNSVTFANVPDIPLTALTLNVTGPSAGKAFTTDCAPASIGGTFTPQSGTAAKTVSAAIKFTGCALKPTITGSTAGLASGHPKLRFKITHGTGAANVATVALGLPGGLKFSQSAIVKHKTCTGTGKKQKCSTKTLIKGLGIVGGTAKSVAITGGKLVITLKKAAGKLTITASGPLVSESKSLQTSVKKHKTKTLKFTVKATDAKHTSTTVALKLRAH
jgi:hypothetical protein